MSGFSWSQAFTVAAGVIIAAVVIGLVARRA